MDRIMQGTQEIFQILKGEKVLLLIIIVAVAAALVLLCLLLYKARSWFGKTGQWLSVLAKMEERLWSIEIQTHSVRESHSARESCGVKETCGDSGQIDASDQLQGICNQGVELAEEMPLQSGGHVVKGKSGKVYTEAELELLIRE